MDTDQISELAASALARDWWIVAGIAVCVLAAGFLVGREL